nr:hypothetical protein [Tanacetum cinerariifolium]
DALDITPTNDSNPYLAPPSSDTVIKYVNTLGYLSTLRKVSAMSVNALYQPWRAILSMINMCLTGLLERMVEKYLEEEEGATESLKATKGTKPKAAKATKPAGDKASMLTSTQPPKPKPTPTQPSKRRTPMLIEASGHAESLSLDAKLPLTDSEIESDNVASKIDTRDQDEGQDGPNLGYHDEGQAGLNLEPVSSTGTLSSLQNLKKELSFTDQFFVEKQQEEEPRKTNDEAEERLYDEFYRLETSIEDVEGVCGAAAYMEQKGKMWPFLGPRNVSRPTPIRSGRSSLEEKKRRDVPRTSFGSPPPHPPPPPPPAGASGAPDSLIQDDSILDEQVHLSDDEDSKNDHLPKAYSRKDCGNRYLKKRDQRLLNLLRPFLLPLYQMLRITGLLCWFQLMKPQLRTHYL